MAENETRLALLTPHGVDAAQAEGLLAALRSAGSAGDVAAVILRLAPADERTLVGLVKRLAPAAQEKGAAVLIACNGFAGDLVSVAARGGADGVHVERSADADLADLRDRLRDGRILGAGGVETRHAAMAAGEAGVDYIAFGGLYPDGMAADPEAVRERAAWWAEIFETPCIAIAARAAEVAALAATGAEFVGLEASIWLEDPEAVARAHSQLAGTAS